MFRAVWKSLITLGPPKGMLRVAGIAGILTYSYYSDPERFQRDAWALRNRIVAEIERFRTKDKQLEEKPKDKQLEERPKDSKNN
jgi:hypothetical protein